MIKTIWLGTAICSLLGTAGIAATLMLARADGVFDISDLRGVERRIGVNFPANSTLVGGRYYAAPLSATLFAVVEMPRGSALSFTHSLSRRIVHSERVVSDRDYDALGSWHLWHPDRHQVLLSAAPDTTDTWVQVSPATDYDCLVYLRWEMQ